MLPTGKETGNIYIKRTIGYSGNHCPQKCVPTIPSISDVQDALFNLADDPTESVNMFDTEPEIAEDLMMLLEEYIVTLPDEQYPDNDPSGNPSNFGGVWSDGWC